MRFKNRRWLWVVLLLLMAVRAAAGQAASFQVQVEQQALGIRFTVQDVNVTSMRVEVAGLDGRTIFASGWKSDQSVTWPMVTPQERSAANGVYLYEIVLRDHEGREYRKLGKLALVQGQEPAFSMSTVGELAGTGPAVAQFPLTAGTSWNQRLGIDRSDTYRIQRRPPRVTGGPPTTFENLLQLEADGKLRIKALCLGTVFAPVTPQNPDNLSNEGDCRSSWSGVTGGGTTNGWTDDGAIVRLANATDKVGIGTTNPTELLTVAGNIDATGQKSKIRFQYDTLADLPSAATYHGMFAHVHATGKAYFAHAGQWVALANEGSSGGASAWSLSGNSGTNPSTNFLGTTSNTALVFRTNNLERMRLSENGSIVIGTNTPCVGQRLQVTKFASGLGCPAPDLLDVAIFAENKDGRAVVGQSADDAGIEGISNSSAGVSGLSKNGAGVKGVSGEAIDIGERESGVGVVGISVSELGAGVLGLNLNGGIGVQGESGKNFGVAGKSEEKSGVLGISTMEAGVAGVSTKNYGIAGGSIESTGVYGESQNGTYIFEGFDGNTNNRRFAVERATGNVKAYGTFTGGGVDYADMLPVTGKLSDYEPGDVLVISLDGKLTKSWQPYSTALAGVYSTKPAFVGDSRGLTEDSRAMDENLVPVALVGLVPVKVSAENGPIHPGDLLTTASIPGHAMKATDPKIGTILGKAMQSLEKGTGVINVLVTLR
ncbi:hypothetical protein HY009_01585 [Candidatus Acetothermia bacterium]|nr:hypothetical protein [Candidatus Acetothermia bacterium]